MQTVNLLKEYKFLFSELVDHVLKLMVLPCVCLSDVVFESLMSGQAMSGLVQLGITSINITAKQKKAYY